jgi:hypothetical protein
MKLKMKREAHPALQGSLWATVSSSPKSFNTMRLQDIVTQLAIASGRQQTEA